MTPATYNVWLKGQLYLTTHDKQSALNAAQQLKGKGFKRVSVKVSGKRRTVTTNPSPPVLKGATILNAIRNAAGKVTGLRVRLKPVAASACRTNPVRRNPRLRYQIQKKGWGGWEVSLAANTIKDAEKKAKRLAGTKNHTRIKDLESGRIVTEFVGRPRAKR